MSNPFDQSFFRFLFGFSFILLVSFALLFFVVKYSTSLEKQEAAVFGAISMKK